MDNRMVGAYSTLLRRALVGVAATAVVVLAAGCGGSSSRSGTAVAEVNKSASASISKFCTDNNNEIDVENQIGDNPDLSDPDTQATFAKLVADLKVMVSEAPATIRSSVQTLESDAADAATSKIPPGGQGKFDAAINAINNWTDANCPDDSSTNDSSGSNATPTTDTSNGFSSINGDQSGSSSNSANSSSAQSDSSSGSNTDSFCSDADSLTSQVSAMLMTAVSSGGSGQSPLGSVPTDANFQQAATQAQNVASEAPADAQSDANDVATDLQGVVNGDSSAAQNLLTDNAALEAWVLTNCDLGSSDSGGQNSNDSGQ
jgi:hypothetical protein